MATGRPMPGPAQAGLVGVDIIERRARGVDAIDDGNGEIGAGRTKVLYWRCRCVAR